MDKTKLTSMGYATYNAYLYSSEWKKCRTTFIAFVANLQKILITDVKCECCGKNKCKFNVHHRSYKNLGNENFNDLILVCENCHLEIHARHDHGQVSLWDATEEVAQFPLRNFDYKVKIKEKKKQKKKVQLTVSLTKLHTAHIKAYRRYNKKQRHKDKKERVYLKIGDQIIEKRLSKLAPREVVLYKLQSGNYMK